MKDEVDKIAQIIEFFFPSNYWALTKEVIDVSAILRYLCF